MRKHDVKLIPSILLLAIALSFLSMHFFDQLKTGLGFGRDMHLVMEVSEAESLQDFLVSRTYQGQESILKSMGEDRYTLSVSGVGSNDEMLNYITRLRVATHKENSKFSAYKYGIFGTNTKYTNMKSFISIQIILILCAVGGYTLLRFGLYGLMHALRIELLLLGTLVATQAMGIPFTKSLWLVSVMIFMMSFFRMSARLRYLNDEQTYHHIRLFEISDAVILLFIGLIMLWSNMFSAQFVAPAWVMIWYSVWMLCEAAIHQFYAASRWKLLYGDSFPEYTTHKSGHVILSFPFFRFLQYSFAFGCIVLLGIGLMNQKPYQLGFEYEEEHVVVVPISQSAKYLDVQALFHKTGILDKQVAYFISEPVRRDIVEDKTVVSTWIFFDQTVNEAALEFAGASIEASLNLAATTYISDRATLPIDTYSLTPLMIGIIGLCAVLFLMNTYDRKVIELVLAIAMSCVVMLICIRVMSIPLSTELISAFLLMPVWSFSTLTSRMFYIEYTKKDNRAIRFYKTLVNFVVALLCVSVPMLIIVPDAFSVQMMLTYIILMLSTLLGLACVDFIFDVLEKRALYDSSIS